VPSTSRHKLWSSRLTEDSQIRRANPLAVVDTRDPADVKALARAVADQESETLYARHGVRVWHSLELHNYAVADAVRALFERDHLAPGPRLHAHSVSSAFGLLGHHYGQQWHTGRQWPDTGAGYFLVQHLGTPDMVASLYHQSFDYRPGWTEREGLFRQDSDPHFPRFAYAPDEQLDRTFYTKAPATSPQMNEIIRRQGGGGVVVSLPECLERYGYVRSLLGAADVQLPADPRHLREWSLVMAVTGVLNAVDRGLVARADVLIHGSGSYGADDYEPPESGEFQRVGTLEDLRRVLLAAAV
jgi:hypothetical protein